MQVSDNQKRPIYLNLFSLHFPITAVLSFGHRVSGIFILLLLPLYIALLQDSLTSTMSFAAVKLMLQQHLLLKLVSVVFLSVLVFHMYAGIRHIFMDCGFGESVLAARTSAWLVFALTSIKAISLLIFFFVVL